MLKKILFIVGVTFIAYSCASTKKAVDISIGSWDYVIKNTPDGDTQGTFIIAKEGESYMGSLNTTQGSVALDDVTVVDKVLKCTFQYMGYTIDMTGTFEGDAFTGKCSVDYNDFPMTAVRKL